MNSGENKTQYDFDKLKKQYSYFSWFQKRYLKKYYGKRKSKEWTQEAKKIFQGLLPDLPYIGDKEYYFTKFLIMTVMLTPIVKILHEAKIPERNIGKMIFDLAESFYSLMPGFISRKRGRKLFTPESEEKWKEICSESKNRDIPFDWVCDFVKGAEDEGFQYGFNMTRCGNVEYWKSLGLEQYVPYLCLCDWPSWKSMGVEASRTQTLGHGDGSCDFRYVKVGREGPRGWPPETLPEWKNE